MSTDVTVEFTGIGARTRAGEVTAVGTIRKGINRLFKETFTRALAWCLYLHADVPKMTVEDIFSWLDEIGAVPPIPADRPKVFKSWNQFHRDCKPKSEKMVSDVRSTLRKNNLPCN